LTKPVDLLVQGIEHGPELHLRHLGKHPDVFDLRRRPVSIMTDNIVGRCHYLDDPSEVGLAARHDHIPMVRPRSQQHVASGLHPFVDQGISELLSLVEQENGLVGDLFLRVCLSLP